MRALHCNPLFVRCVHATIMSLYLMVQEVGSSKTVAWQFWAIASLWTLLLQGRYWPMLPNRPPKFNWKVCQNSTGNSRPTFMQKAVHSCPEPYEQFSQQLLCYDPPQFFSSLSDPLLVTLPMPKQPLPLNPPSLPDLPLLPPSEPSKPSSPLDQPPVKPLVPVLWNIHRREEYHEPSPVENPLEDPDSPMEDAPPLKPEPFIPYEPDVPGGNTHALSPEESPVIPWQEYLVPDSPVSRKHSLSPTSPSSAPIRQRTSREGSYHSIMPTASSPIAGTSPQSQDYQLTSPRGSADNPSPTQSSADDTDSNMALNWVTINMDYLKG